jgi:hypothetical protein
MKTTSGVDYMKPPKKMGAAWFGIDSLRGRYLTGTIDSIHRGLIEPGETATITEAFYQLFKGERLFVKSTCAPSFLIRYVFVGAECGPFAGSAGSPIIAEPFAVKFEALADLKLALDDKNILHIDVDKPALDFLGAPFPLPTAQPGLSLSFCVENIGKEPMRFLGALLGQAAW